MVDAASRARVRERALRAMLRAPEDLAYPLISDLSHRPVTVDVVEPRPELSKLQKVAACLFVAFPALFVVLGTIDGNVMLLAIAVFMLALAGFTFWLIRLRSGMAWRVTWGPDEVEVLDRRWGRNATWSAPYGEFQGVAFRNGTLPRYSGGSYQAGRPIHVVELVHAEPDRTVLIASCDRSPDIEERTRNTALSLNVPFLGDTT